MENPPVVEEWKSAVSSRFPDLVKDIEVSNLGNVRKKTTGYLFKAKDHKDGYPCIKRLRKTLYRHTLVAETFLGVRPEGMVIDHLDNNKENSCVSNLRYTTIRDNSIKNNKKVNPDGTLRPMTLEEKANARHLKENMIRNIENLTEKMKKAEQLIETLQEQNANQQKMIEDAYRAINTLFMLYQNLPTSKSA